MAFLHHDLHCALREELNPYFEHKRYVWNHAIQGYVRKTHFGWSSFVLTVGGSEAYPTADVYAGLRLELVERPLSGLFGRTEYFSAISHTLLVSSSKLAGLVRAQALTNQTIEQTGARVVENLDDYAFDFLSRYVDLEELTDLLNRSPERYFRLMGHNWYRPFRALMVSQLVGDPLLEMRFWQHRTYLQQRGCPEVWLQRFDALAKYLHAMVLN